MRGWHFYRYLRRCFALWLVVVHLGKYAPWLLRSGNMSGLGGSSLGWKWYNGRLGDGRAWQCSSGGLGNGCWLLSRLRSRFWSRLDFQPSRKAISWAFYRLFVDLSRKGVFQSTRTGIRWKLEDFTCFLVTAKWRARVDSLLQYSWFPGRNEISVVSVAYRS